MNLAHVLRQNARRFPERHGLLWGEKGWTWQEIEREVNALAAALQARGIGKGDRLIVHSKNTAQMFFSLFAAFKLGVVWVPTNFRLMPEEVIYLADFSGAKGFLCHGDFPSTQQPWPRRCRASNSSGGSMSRRAIRTLARRMSPSGWRPSVARPCGCASRLR